MPDADPDVLAIMNLHARCRNSGSLPCSGGILDQPAYLMDLFDVVDAARAEFRDKAQERAESEDLKARLAQGLERGR